MRLGLILNILSSLVLRMQTVELDVIFHTFNSILWNIQALQFEYWNHKLSGDFMTLTFHISI